MLWDAQKGPIWRLWDMPRTWDTETERKRKAEYRARKRLEEIQAPAGAPAEPGELSELEARKLAEALEGARLVSVELKEGPEVAEGRRQRAERYFRWRLATSRAVKTASPW
jgi:hypothetical protein